MEALDHSPLDGLRMVRVKSSVLVGVCGLAVHNAGQASVGFSMDQGVQEGNGVVLLHLDGETDAAWLEAVQVVR